MLGGFAPCWDLFLVVGLDVHWGQGMLIRSFFGIGGLDLDLNPWFL